MNSQKSFVIPLIVVIVAILAIGGGVYYYKNIYRCQGCGFVNPTISTTTNTVVCTMDVMMCPDGSYVSRGGPKCEFAPCSIANQNIIKLNQRVTIDGVSITPLEVVSDSRCTDMCVWAGTVMLRVKLTRMETQSTSSINPSATVTVPSEAILTLGQPYTFFDRQITLINVSPEAGQIKPLLPEDYSFVFTVTGSTSGLRVCPQTKYSNQMPIPSGPNTNPPSTYYVLNGQSYALNAFDIDWVNANCQVQELIVN